MRYKLTTKAKEKLTLRSWKREKGAGGQYQNGGCGLSEISCLAISKAVNVHPKLWETWNLGSIIEKYPAAERELARFAFEQMGRKDLSSIDEQQSTALNKQEK